MRADAFHNVTKAWVERETRIEVERKRNRAKDDGVCIKTNQMNT